MRRLRPPSRRRLPSVMGRLHIQAWIALWVEPIIRRRCRPLEKKWERVNGFESLANGRATAAVAPPAIGRKLCVVRHARLRWRSSISIQTSSMDISKPALQLPVVERFARPTTVSIVLFPGFSMMSLASTTEPLRAANLLSGCDFYHWRIVSTDGADPVSSSGFQIKAGHNDLAPPESDLLLVIASLDFDRLMQPRLLDRLSAAAACAKAIGAVSHGSLVLAGAGLLDGYRCTGHWDRLRELQERHPLLAVTREVYCLDRDRWTCGGGAAAMDMMLALIRAQHGQALAMKVANNFIHGRVRLPGEMQPMEIRWRYGVKDRRLVTAIGCMEQSIKSPLRVSQIATVAGLSVRQLQRLFLTELTQSPDHFYIEMRMRAANDMLEQTDDPVGLVAAQCGFSSPSHFARAFHATFGHRPSDVRRAKAR